MSCNSWKEYKLEEICVDITDGSHSSPNSVEYGYPMASVKDMEYHKINLESCRKISEEDYNKLVKGKCKPNVGDVLIAKDGSYLKHVNVVKEEIDLVILSSIAILRPNLEKINPDFLKYYLLNPQVKQTLEQGYVSGSAIRRIVLKDFKRFIVEIPSLKEQKKIVDVLTSLDQKIELNNEMNKTLEEMAQALFKRWFVDFEFPNEEGKPYKSSGGEMVESELGMIPKGWKVYSIADVCDINSSNYSAKEQWSYINYLDTANITKNKIDTIQNIDCKNAKVPSRAKRKVKEDSIVYSTVRPNQLHYGIIKKTVPNMIVSTGFVVLDSKLNYIKNDIIYYWLIQDKNTELLQSIGETSTSTYPSIKPSDIGNMKLVLPPEKFIENLANKFDEINKLIEELKVEEKQLIYMRDLLLPKLMSGEIYVNSTSFEL